MSRNRSLLASLSGIIALALISCACWFVPVAKTVLDIADRICIIDRIALPDDEVRKLCKIAEPNVPAMRDLLSAKRADAFLSAHRDAGAQEAGPSDASFDADSQ